MKAIFVNAVNETVEMLDIDQGIDIIKKLLECRYFDVAGYLPNGDAVYVDDEGLCYQPKHFVGLGIKDGYPYAGHALIIGSDNEGGSKDCASTVEEIEDLAVFMSKADALLWARVWGA